MSDEILSLIASQIPTLIIAGFALFYSIKSYQQANKITNENILYQEKIQGYKAITYALSDLLNSIQLNFYFTKDLVTKSKLTDEEIEDINNYADEIDDKTDEFDNVVKANSIILPTKILKSIEELIDQLYEGQSVADLEKKDINHYDEMINNFLEKSDKLIVLIGKDLKSKNLNKTLFKRIKTIRTKKKAKN